MDLQEIGWEDVDSINVAEDRATCCAVVNTAIELQGCRKRADCRDCTGFLEVLPAVTCLLEIQTSSS